MAKKKAAANETSQIQALEEQFQKLDQKGEEFRKEMYNHLEIHTKKFQEQKDAQQVIQQALQQQMNRMIEMMKALPLASQQLRPPTSPVQIFPHASPVQTTVPPKQINLGGNGILPTPAIAHKNL